MTAKELCINCAFFKKDRDPDPLLDLKLMQLDDQLELKLTEGSGKPPTYGHCQLSRAGIFSMQECQFPVTEYPRYTPKTQG